MIHKWVLILFVQIKFLLNTVFFSVTSRTNYNINNYYWSVSLFALNNESIFNITLEDSTWGAAAAVTTVFPPSASALFSFISLSLLFGLFHSLFLTHTSIHQTSFLYHVHTTHTYTPICTSIFTFALNYTRFFGIQLIPNLI